MTVDLPSVSVVIPTFRRRGSLQQVVDAAATDPHASEIVVVVDGADDGSLELLKEMANTDPRIRPVWQDNAGGVAARQTGVEQARGDVVLLLDDDVIAGPDLAARHARAHLGHTGLVVVGYMPVARPSRRQPGEFATLLYGDDYERACVRYEHDASLVLRHLWMGNISMRREDALRVGIKGPRRLRHHEDQEFGLRCLRAGLAGVFDRSLTATHLHERDLLGLARQSFLQGAARRYLLTNFPDLLDERDLRDNLPAPIRAVVEVAAAPPIRPAARAALCTGVRVAGRLRLWPAETVLARLLEQVELTYGYRHGTAGQL